MAEMKYYFCLRRDKDNNRIHCFSYPHDALLAYGPVFKRTQSFQDLIVRWNVGNSVFEYRMIPESCVRNVYKLSPEYDFHYFGELWKLPWPVLKG